MYLALFFILLYFFGTLTSNNTSLRVMSEFIFSTNQSAMTVPF